MLVKKKKTNSEKNKDKFITTWLNGREANMIPRYSDHHNKNINR